MGRIGLRLDGLRAILGCGVDPMKYPIEPVPKPRMTRRDKWRKRPCVMRYRAFKDKCRAHRVELPQPCHVVFWMPMPDSWPESKREIMNGARHTQRPDVDNLGKGLLDAVLQEDSHIWNVRFEKRWSLTPGIEIIALEEEA